MQELNIPGAAVALIENGRIATLRVYGIADKETGAAVTPDTLFSLQSISKSIAAWGVMRLVEQGQVDLEAPIWDYVRGWRLPPSPFDEWEVTLRRLLCHYAGISTAGFPGIDPARDMPSLIDGLNGLLGPLNDEQQRYWALWNLPTDWPVKLAYRPGEAFHYSNPGFGLLELMIEEVTGQSFCAFIEESILRPLGMRNSSFSVDSRRPYAKPYGIGGESVRAYRYVSKAAAGLYATIGDLAAFACAEMKGPQGESPGRDVLSPGSITAMFESQGLADEASWDRATHRMCTIREAASGGGASTRFFRIWALASAC